MQSMSSHGCCWEDTVTQSADEDPSEFYLSSPSTVHRLTNSFPRKQHQADHEHPSEVYLSSPSTVHRLQNPFHEYEYKNKQLIKHESLRIEYANSVHMQHFSTNLAPIQYEFRSTSVRI